MNAKVCLPILENRTEDLTGKSCISLEFDHFVVMYHVGITIYHQLENKQEFKPNLFVFLCGEL